MSNFAQTKKDKVIAEKQLFNGIVSDFESQIKFRFPGKSTAKKSVLVKLKSIKDTLAAAVKSKYAGN